VVSMVSLGLVRDDDQIGEHFLDGCRGSHDEYLWLDMDAAARRTMVQYALALQRGALDNMSDKDVWSKYQCLTVFPERTWRFVVEGWRYRKEVMRLVSHGVG